MLLTDEYGGVKGTENEEQEEEVEEAVFCDAPSALPPIAIKKQRIDSDSDDVRVVTSQSSGGGGAWGGGDRRECYGLIGVGGG